MRHICALSGIEVRITWHKPPAHNNSHNRSQKHKHRQGQPPLIPQSSLWPTPPPPSVRSSPTPRPPRPPMSCRTIPIPTPPHPNPTSLFPPPSSCTPYPPHYTTTS